ARASRNLRRRTRLRSPCLPGRPKARHSRGGRRPRMPDLPPSPESVAAHVAAFERELAAAPSARDAQAVRDRYLGRKHSIVATWMQRVATAAPGEKRSIGRYANELKQAIEARWTVYAETATERAVPGAIDVTLPGRAPLLGRRHPLTIVRER